MRERMEDRTLLESREGTIIIKCDGHRFRAEAQCHKCGCWHGEFGDWHRDEEAALNAILDDLRNNDWLDTDGGGTMLCNDCRGDG